MSRLKNCLLASLLLVPLAAPTLKVARAEQPAPPPGDQDRPDRDGAGGPPPPDGGSQHPGPGGGRGPGGRDGRPDDKRPGGGGDNRGGPRQPGGAGGDSFDRMRGYLDLVDRFARLARDPAASGVAAVISAGDILRPRGADAVIQYYTKALDTVKNDTVKRAIRIQLVDLYRQSGQNEKALEQLTELMNSAPAGDAPASIQPGR